MARLLIEIFFPAHDYEGNGRGISSEIRIPLSKPENPGLKARE
jgi:hypothetical protein